METTKPQITLGDLPIGARIIVKCKKEWRGAVVSKSDGEKITLIVCSPTGRTYRLHRNLKTELIFEGEIPLLKIVDIENWRENFTKYDFRW